MMLVSAPSSGRLQVKLVPREANSVCGVFPGLKKLLNQIGTAISPHEMSLQRHLSYCALS